MEREALPAFNMVTVPSLTIVFAIENLTTELDGMAPQKTRPEPSEFAATRTCSIFVGDVSDNVTDIDCINGAACTVGCEVG